MVINLTRLALAISATLIAHLYRSEPICARALAAYTAYSALILALSSTREFFSKSVPHWAHWADVLWGAMIVWLSGCSLNLTFALFLFPVLAAATRGFAGGVRVTLAVTGCSIVGVVGRELAGAPVALAQVLAPLLLLIIGVLLAYWVSIADILRRRLALLKDVTSLSNPRFGIDHTVGVLIERLREFHAADACLLLMADADTDQYRLRRADRRRTSGLLDDRLLTADCARLLLNIPPSHAVIYRGPGRWQLVGRYYYAFDTETGARRTDGLEQSETLATALDARSLLTIPLRSRNVNIGRIYLTSARRSFNVADAVFLQQIIEHVMPVIENIRLVDQLASDAAEQERRRIARDIHDSVIQPYIGLQLGLSAVRAKLLAGDYNLGRDIDQLHEMTAHEIDELRQMVHGLKQGGGRSDNLLPALRRYAAKFSQATGINVKIEAKKETGARLNDRLAAEMFQIVAEGLSNIRRHTQAVLAKIEIMQSACCVKVRIENEGAGQEMFKPFVPRSISERSAALGGRAHVERSPEGATVVTVEVPL